MPTKGTRTIFDEIGKAKAKVTFLESALAGARTASERQQIIATLTVSRQDLKTLEDIAGMTKHEAGAAARVKHVEKSTTNRAKAQASNFRKQSLVKAAENTSSASGEVKVEEIDAGRLTRDFVYFCEKCLVITYRPGMNKDNPFGGFGPMILSEAQIRVMAVLIRILLVLGKPLRGQILKTRQLGNTTLLLAFAVWLMITHPHYHVMLIIDKNSHNKTKRNMVVAWLDYIQENFKHVFPNAFIKKGGRGEKMLELENGSKMFFESAESPNPGTSEMIHFLIESEKPKWPDGRAELVRTSVIPGIPRAPMTVHIDESTAHGIDPFKRKWDRNTTAAKGSTDVVCIFLPWNISNEYREEPAEDCWDAKDRFIYLDDDAELNDYDEDLDRELVESEFAAKYKLAPDQVFWRRNKIKSDFDGDRGGFDQEYPITPSHAYRRYQLGFFPATVHKYLKDNTGEIPYEVGTMLDSNGYADVSRPTLYSALKPLFSSDRRGDLYVRERPKPGMEYFVGADTAEGKVVLDDFGRDDPDYTIFSIKNKYGKTVALYISRVRAEHAWFDLVLIAMWYNMAWVNGEKNNTGLSLLSQFWLTGYPRNLISALPKGAPVRDRAWTYTSSKNRNPMLVALRRSISTDPSRLFAVDIEESPLRQYCNFITNSKTGKVQAASGFHDDIPMGEALAEECRKWKLGAAYTADMMVEQPAVPAKEPVWADEVVELHGGFRIEDTDFYDMLGVN